MPEAATTDQPQAEFEDDLSAGRAPEPDIEIAPAPPFAMSAELANALTVRAPLTEPQLLGMIDHFGRLEAMLRVSGPTFANHRRDAARMHNTCMGRLEEVLREAAPRGDVRLPEGMVPLQP